MSVVRGRPPTFAAGTRCKTQILALDWVTQGSLSQQLGANEAFDKKQMQPYFRVFVILGDVELNAVFHLLGINSRNSRLI